MAQIILNIPDDKLTRVIDGFAGQFNYQDEVDPGNGILVPNPESKSAFAKRMLYNVIKSAVKSYEAQSAAEAARLLAIQSVEDEIIFDG